MDKIADFDLTGVNWSTWGKGQVGAVRTLVDAKRFELALIEAGYVYEASQTSGHGDSEYCEITYRGPEDNVLYLRYHPQGGEPRWRWQMVGREPGDQATGRQPGPWQPFGDVVEQWPRPGSTERETAKAHFGVAWYGERPVLLPIPVDLDALVRAAGGSWDAANNRATVRDGDGEVSLTTTLRAIGFRHTGRGEYLDDHSGQRLTLVRNFDN